jgi:hypothetical protein
MRRLAFLILLGGVFLAGDVNGQSKQLRTNHDKNQTVEHGHSAQNEQQPEVPLAVYQASEARFIDAIRAINEQTSAEQIKAYTDQNGWYSPAVKVQVFLCIVGAAYTVFAALQWLAIRKSLRVSERAYISVTPMEILNLRQGAAPAMTLGLRNEGNTPAYKVRCWCAIAKVGSPFPTKSEAFPQGRFGPEFTLIQQATFRLLPTLTNTLSEREVAALLKAETARLYVWGRVEYRDAFGKRRWVNFRSFVRDDPPNSFPDEEGNDAN